MAAIRCACSWQILQSTCSRRVDNWGASSWQPSGALACGGFSSALAHGALTIGGPAHGSHQVFSHGSHNGQSQVTRMRRLGVKTTLTAPAMLISPTLLTMLQLPYSLQG